jgi:hypothetical protein
MVEEGLLLIVDEFQHIKNKTAQRSAIEALTRAIFTRKNNSRNLFLSGTAFDKEEQVINFLRTVGIIDNYRLFIFHKETGVLQLLGAQNLIDYCKRYDAKRTQEILDANPFKPKNASTVCYQLWIGLLQHLTTSSMPPPPIEFENDCKNGYYNLSAPGQKNLLKSIASLGQAARYNRETGTVATAKRELGAITNALEAIEIAKIEIFIRLARHALMASPNNKVGISFNYKIPLHAVADALIEYHPLILDGDVVEKKRRPIINLFQQADNKHRLILGNMQVMAEGIDLHDMDGRFPRFAFGSPNYVIMRIHQWSLRWYRQGVKSAPHIRLIYGKCGAEETSILNALARKNKVLKETNETQVEAEVRFPAEYPREEEGEVVPLSPPMVPPPPPLTLRLPPPPTGIVLPPLPIFSSSKGNLVLTPKLRPE